MEKISYDYIKPLISREEIRGSELYCEFTCPKTGKMIEASAYINQSPGNQVQENFKRGLLYSIQSTISSLIYNLFSSFGMVGNIVGSATSNATSSMDINPSQKISKKEKENAAIEAFKSVIFNFYWDEKGKRWLIMKDPSQFMIQLKEQPIEEKYDKETTARMLVELSNIDGKITSEEKEFLNNFIHPDVGSVKDFLKKEKLSIAELKELSSKESSLMLAWTIALIDENVADQEKKRLKEYGTVFEIDEERQNELKKLAQYYIIENAASIGELEKKEDVLALGKKIGLSNEDAERAWIAYKKRS